MAFFLSGLPDLLWAVVEFLGVSVAPVLCSAAMDLVPPLALEELPSRIAAVEQLLRILPASSSMPGAAEPSRIADLLRFLRYSKSLVELVTLPLRRLQSVPLFYPPFTEASEVGLLLVARPSAHQSLVKVILEHSDFGDDEPPFDLAEFLADMLDVDNRFPELDDFLAVWAQKNVDTGAFPHVQAVVTLLSAGTYETLFYPSDCPLLILTFNIFGVAGAFVAEEPFVDPVGLHI